MQNDIRWTIDPVLSFNKLSQGMQRKALRIALNAGAAPMKVNVTSGAPSETGSLQKSMRIKTKNYKNSNIWVAIIGASIKYIRNVGRGKNKKVYRPAKYQKLVDQGNENIQGKQFMKSAFQSGYQQFVNRVFQKLREVVPQIMREATK